MEKPREFWIQWPSFLKNPLGQVYNIKRMVLNYAAEDCVRVVEHSAYAKCVAALNKIFDETEGRGEMRYPTTDMQPILKIAYDTLKDLGEL